MRTKFSKNDQIGGQPIKIVRDVLRRMKIDEWSAAGIADLLKIDERAARPVIDGMIAAGFLEECPRINRRERARFYRHGPSASRLCNTRFVKRIERAKADKILADLVERASAINARPDLAVGIGEIRVFGSYLTKEADLGDVDVAVEYVRKAEGNEGTEWSLQRARESGRQFRNFLEKLFFGDREVQLLLRNRNAYLSLHPMRDLEEIKARSRVVFRARPDTIAGFRRRQNGLGTDGR